MASSQKSAAKQQVELWIELKEHVDLVYKQLNQYRGACRSADRLNRAVRRTGAQLDPDRMLYEFCKFERDYRVSRKRLRKLDRQLLAVNLYDKLYDLYESLVMGESIGAGEDMIDSSAIVVDCNGPVGIEDNFAGISIDHDTHIDVEMNLLEDACLEPRQSATLNHSLNKSSTDSSRSSSILVADVSARTRVTRQQTRRRMVTFGFVSRKMKKHEANIDSSAIVVGCKRPVEIENNSVDDIACTERPFQCPQCVKSFKTSSILSRHKRTHESKPRFKCKWEGCDFGTNYSEAFKAHQSVHTGKHRFKCSWDGCDFGAYYSHALKHHQTVHTGERSFQCSQCGKLFKTSSILSIHKRTHESEPRFKCSWKGCDFRTNINYYLKKHMSVHSDERPFQCPQCDKTFKTSTNLGSHRRTHESEPRFKCSWVGCDYGTYYSRALKDHQTVHTGERPFQCPQCDKSFKSASQLCSHKWTHESEPRFKCSWEGCDYGTYYSQALKAHQTVHTRKLEFKCSWEECDFRTNNNKYLKKHMSVHTGKRPFQCSQCDKSFKTSSALSIHKRIHESEPRFKCSWEGCDYGSHQLFNLTRHQNRHMANRN